ncbi:VW5B1 protein, partial [Corythaeola cristata]|nr:VW5B1 protein [Corythaeola cristata]
GSGRRYQVNAVHTSKACNVISKYTAFMPVDLSTNAYLPTVVEYTHTGAASKQGSQRSLSLGNRRHRGFSPGRPHSACGQNGDDGFYGMSKIPWERPCRSPARWRLRSGGVPDVVPPLQMRRRAACRPAAPFPPRAGSAAVSPKVGERADGACQGAGVPSREHKSLVSSRQLLVPDGHGKSPTTRDTALGAVPEGPGSHAEDAGRPRHFSGSAVESVSKALKAEKELSPPTITIRRFSSPESTAEWQADSGRGSQTDGSEVQALLFDIELQQQTEPEGMLWATAVALAWLEHSSASYFIEWELVAAKASLWLSQQDFPEGYSLATVKAAAQQLFVLLRHWDENLEFNLLCYNPSSV